MDAKMIKKLKDAGVAADVILGLILEDETVPAEPEKVTPEPAAAPEPEPAKEEKPAAKTPDPDPVLAKLDSLIGAIQASNILRSGRDTVAETVDDILARMMTPGSDKEVK